MGTGVLNFDLISEVIRCFFDGLSLQTVDGHDIALCTNYCLDLCAAAVEVHNYTIGFFFRYMASG